eukprot:c19126_g1_i1 orf=379-822(+)
MIARSAFAQLEYNKLWIQRTSFVLLCLNCNNCGIFSLNLLPHGVNGSEAKCSQNLSLLIVWPASRSRRTSQRLWQLIFAEGLQVDYGEHRQKLLSVQGNQDLLHLLDVKRCLDCAAAMKRPAHAHGEPQACSASLATGADTGHTYTY